MAFQITTQEEKDKLIYDNKFALSLAIIGLLFGLYFAYRSKSKWYGYVGYGILFNTLGSLLGQAIDFQRKEKPKQ